MKRRIVVLAAFIIVLAAGSVLLAQDNPFVGTWKLNVASSKYDPGPAPQSQTRTWDAEGMVMVTGVGATGKPMAYGYPIKGDGKQYPTIVSVPKTADMISTKQTDADTIIDNLTKAANDVETAICKRPNAGRRWRRT